MFLQLQYNYLLTLFREAENMESLHLRVDQRTIENIMSVINQISSEGEVIEIVDNLTFDLEQKMILKSLKQEKENGLYEHDEVWTELLK